MVVMGVSLTLLYHWANSTSAGSIMEIAGAGYLFLFIGTLSILGEAFGIAPSDDK